MTIVFTIRMVQKIFRLSNFRGLTIVQHWMSQQESKHTYSCYMKKQKSLVLLQGEFLNYRETDLEHYSLMKDHHYNINAIYTIAMKMQKQPNSMTIGHIVDVSHVKELFMFQFLMFRQVQSSFGFFNVSLNSCYECI